MDCFFPQFRRSRTVERGRPWSSQSLIASWAGARPGRLLKRRQTPTPCRISSSSSSGYSRFSSARSGYMARTSRTRRTVKEKVTSARLGVHPSNVSRDVGATDTFSWVPLRKRSQYQEIPDALGKIDSVQQLSFRKPLGFWSQPRCLAHQISSCSL